MSIPPDPQTTFDGRYYRNTGSMDFARRISTVARRRVHNLFMQTMQPQPCDRILDIGTSDDAGIEGKHD